MAFLFWCGFRPMMPGGTHAGGAAITCAGAGPGRKHSRRKHQQHRHETNDRVLLSRHLAKHPCPSANNGTDDNGILFQGAKRFWLLLDFPAEGSIQTSMAHTYLIFDFGENEEAAQHARHKLEGWKQAFRLDKKLLFKFERSESAKAESSAGAKPAAPAAAKPEKGKSKADTSGKAKETASEKPNSAEAGTENGGRVRLLVRLDFSDHEKLSQQRWLERIPADDHFKGASPKRVLPGAPESSETAKLFDSLD